VGTKLGMRPLLATIAVLVALIVLSVVAIASASGGRQSAVSVGGMHDVTVVDHHWTTVHRH
jgi:hypothetical protein